MECDDVVGGEASEVLREAAARPLAWGAMVSNGQAGSLAGSGSARSLL
jgi:hypothetical protein